MYGMIVFRRNFHSVGPHNNRLAAGGRELQPKALAVLGTEEVMKIKYTVTYKHNLFLDVFARIHM